MSIDDPRFEDYLRKFHPIDPPMLKLKKSRRASGRLRLAWTMAIAVAAILTVAFLTWHPRTTDRIEGNTSGAQCCVGPLTVGGANASIFGTASTKQVLDRMVFRQPVKLPKGRQSALTVLGEEKAEL